MATEIVISNKDYISIDSYYIRWEDKGDSMPVLPDTIHYVIWRSSGINEIQNKDASTGMMTGNVPLSSTSDAVGSTTIEALLSWADIRLPQIKSARLDIGNARENGLTKWINDGNQEADFTAENSLTHTYFDWSKSWVDYDENYS